jgi:hypothetical protein
LAEEGWELLLKRKKRAVVAAVMTEGEGAGEYRHHRFDW